MRNGRVHPAHQLANRKTSATLPCQAPGEAPVTSGAEIREIITGGGVLAA